MTPTTLPDSALSIRQPWAWAVVQGLKDVENRSAFAVSKGELSPRRVAVHGMTRDEYEAARGFMARLGVECPRPDVLVRGAVIGAVTIDAVVKASNSPWFVGPRGLLLSGAEAVAPIPAIGALGYFGWQANGVREKPLPWMIAWPDHHRRNGAAARAHSLPLFGDGAGMFGKAER